MRPAWLRFWDGHHEYQDQLDWVTWGGEPDEAEVHAKGQRRSCKSCLPVARCCNSAIAVD
jgi:hypothetical protein